MTLAIPQLPESEYGGTVWHHQRNPWKPPPPTPAHLDDLVIGAGVAGLSTAIALASRGRQVAVIEAFDHVGGGTTARSTGKLELLQGTRLVNIYHQLGERTLGHYVQVCQTAATWLEDVIERHDVPHQRRASVTWAQHPSGVATLTKLQCITNNIGLATELHSPPAGLPGVSAVYLPEQRQVNPLALVEALGAEAADLGVNFYMSQRIHRTRRSRGRVIAQGEDGFDLSAANVVIATGTPITLASTAYLVTRPYRSHVVAFELPESSPQLGVMAKSADSPSISLRDASPEHPNVCLVSGGAAIVGTAQNADSGRDELRRWAHEHLPDPVEVAAWSAQDYMCADDYPLVGRAELARDHYVITGMGGWGLLGGAAAGWRIAQAIATDRKLPRPRSSRWVNPHTVGSTLGRNLTVGKDLLKGWWQAATTASPAPGPEPEAPADSPAAASLEATIAPTPPVEAVGEVSRGFPPRATVTVNGVTYTCSAICPHLGGIVRWNHTEQTWECPLHGSRFNYDGTVLNGPATTNLSPLTPEHLSPEA